METLCGVGLPEMVIIALVGFVVVGPERSKEVALQAGRFLRKVLSSEWWGEFNQITTAIRDLPNTLVRLAELEEAQAEFKDVMGEINETEREIRRETRIKSGASKQSAASKKPDSAGESEVHEPAEGTISTDPWDIANASAQTTFMNQSDDSADQPDEEANDRDS